MSEPRLAKGLALPADTESYAQFSPDMVYRYLLVRRLKADALQALAGRLAEHKAVVFVMLNPSCATAEQDDRTLAKCWRLTRRWGYTAMRIVNVYARRATDPADLWLGDVEPIGADRNKWLSAALDGVHSEHALRHDLVAPYFLRRPAELVVCAWGNNVRPYHAADVRRLVHNSGVGHRARCFAVSKQDQPVHPLYQKEDQPLKEYML